MPSGEANQIDLIRACLIEVSFYSLSSYMHFKGKCNQIIQGKPEVETEEDGQERLNLTLKSGPDEIMMQFYATAERRGEEMFM